MAILLEPVPAAYAEPEKLDYTPQSVPPAEPTVEEDKTRKHYLNHEFSLLGWLLFHQLPSPWTWAGAPILIAAGLVILWREQRLRITGSNAAAVPEVVE